MHRSVFTYSSFLIALLMVLALHSSARARTIQQPVVQQYELDVAFYPDESRMSGTARIRFEPLPDSLPFAVFYLHGELDVDSIKVGDALASFEQEQVFYEDDYSMVATRVVVKPVGNLQSMDVHYEGYFHPSKARSPSDYMRIDQQGVYLRSFGYSLWFPVFLDAGEPFDPLVSFSRVVLRTPEAFRAVFVGQKVGEQVVDGQRISEWTAEETPLFAAQVSAHAFDVHTEGSYFIYARQEAASLRSAPQIAAFAAELNTFFQSHYRSTAATDQVHIVEMPRFGDISSNNMIGISSSNWQQFTEQAYAQRTLAHEFVHPFVRIPFPAGDPLGAMIIEGFPSYFHLPALAEIYGEAYYNTYMDQVQEGYLSKRATGTTRRGWPLPEDKPLIGLRVSEIGEYKDFYLLNDRALLFLDSLRREMGAAVFLTFARELFNRNSVSLEEFKSLVLIFLPESSSQLHTWLETTHYPVELQRVIGQ